MSLSTPKAIIRRHCGQGELLYKIGEVANFA
jgi:hypothetical protein